MRTQLLLSGSRPLTFGLLITFIAGMAAFVATWMILRHARRLGVIQVPNARSSHTIPTASGGGVGIVIGGAIGTSFAALQAPWEIFLFLATSLIVAAIGFYDDRKPIPAGFRLAAHMVLLAVAVLGIAPIHLLTAELAPGWPTPLVVALLVLGGVYWVNLLNFMDGIDGLAASQAIVMLLSAVLLALAGTPGVASHPGLWWLIGLAAASFGFLLLNWPPAKIFMGDAGSTYLGFVIAVLALLTIAWGWLSIWQWAILGAPFVTDATVTLLRRLFAGEKVLEAHRRHAYQVLSRRWKSHLKVTLLFIGVDLFWALPLAFAAGAFEAFAPLVAIVAYAPLVVLALVAGAGAPETRTAT